MTAAAIANVLGGQKALKKRVGSDDDLVLLVRNGLPIAAFSSLAEKWPFKKAELAKAVGMSSRTLTRRISSHSRMSTAESDRTVRLARLLAFTNDIFGDRDKAAQWLKTPNVVLGKPPIELLDTDSGIRSVETILGRIAWGIYS
jgi:putative toxin-antitoxin system antitoxin component (TIGR02293 family)